MRRSFAKGVIVERRRQNRRLVLFSIAMVVVGMGGCDRLDFPGSDTREKTNNHLGKAKKLYERRDYTGAIGEYEEILRTDSSYADADLQIGLIYDRNLGDYLDAAFYYQRYLNSGHVEPGKSELARSFLENARLQFAASVPNSASQGSPELVKLRSENSALYRQVEDLKKEIVALREKGEGSGNTTSRVYGANPPPIMQSPPSPQLPPPSSHKTSPKPSPSKTYVVKKGDGIQSISEKVYGDRSRWKDILAANPEIKDPNVLVPGQVLKLPK